jgi:sialate O-acetylesterase
MSVLSLVLTIGCTGNFAIAAVKLPAIFTDHVVLQRDMKLPVWGWADPGEKVAVTIADQTQSAIANEQGQWKVILAPMSATLKPLTLNVTGSNNFEVKDVLVGEVWICAGQSNMEFNVKDTSNGDLDVASADYPAIRLLSVKEQGSQTKVQDFHGQWRVCFPQTIGSFSAVGYFFGRELYEQLKVPVGLIDNSWGGSTCEAWIRRDRLEGNELYDATLKANDQVAADPDAKAKFDAAFAEWDKLAQQARQANEPEPPNRPWWNDPVKGQFRAANIYHSRLEPILPFGIRGVIWYQGESNVARAFQYREMFPLLIKSWRADWGQGDFPFYWVQLPNFMPFSPTPTESGWAELRDAQACTQDRLPNTGQAVAIDLGDPADVHPRNKLDVARRLARWALARDYRQDVVYRSPRYDSMTITNGKISVSFHDVGTGLQTLRSQSVHGFSIAGDERRWVWADAKIIGKDHVEIYGDKVSAPVAVRYGWADNPECNLYGSSGLPVTPFRTDYWPAATRDAR